MIERIAEYTVKPGEKEAVRAAIRTFVAAVAANEPGTRYRAFARVGTRRYVHTMAFPTENAEEAHRSAAHTAAFVAAMYPRCESEPSFSALAEVR
jgi:quinol monooxygenase YgiN